MPAKSKAQQRLMAMALHSPEKVRGKNRDVLKMSKDDLGDYASTKRKGLPTKTKKRKKQWWEELK